MRRMMSVAVGVAGCVAVLAGQAAQTPPAPSARTIPVGAQFNVLLQTPLSSATTKIDQHFNAGSLDDWKIAGQVVVEAGATIRGFVSSVGPSTRQVAKGQATGIGQMTLAFDELLIGEKPVRMRASVIAVLDPRRQPDDTRRSSTANVVGGIDSFGLPAWTDVVVTGGSITPVGGGDVKLPVGLVLRIRLDQALTFPNPQIDLLSGR